jgi:predicted metal-dependent hydrolase
MREFLLFFLSIFVIFNVVNGIYKKNQEIKQVKSPVDGRKYIVRKLPDSQAAADKLANINKKIISLVDSLEKDDRKGIKRLKERYNPDQLSETGLGAKYTSYSVNKGEKISICVRQTDNSFINDNIIIFVFIHELAHVMTEEVGHTPKFWDNMAYLLEQGEKIGIYVPEDYGENPVDYCGMEINSTPYKKFN